jgi:hypothetical protein
MKHLKTYKIFESDNKVDNKNTPQNEGNFVGYNKDDIVKILFKLEGSEKSEFMKVRINHRIKNSNAYSVSFKVDGNPMQNHPDITIPITEILIDKETKKQKRVTKMIPSQELKQPEQQQSQQPVPTDYNAAGQGGQGGGPSNDFVLPNS